MLIFQKYYNIPYIKCNPMVYLKNIKKQTKF